MQKIATFIICTLLIVGCTTKSDSDKKTIFVTITPMQSIIEEITAGDFDIEVIVPKGASPETFEPTPKQVTAFSDAEFIFSTGLIDFEQSLVKRISGSAELVNLSEGIELIAGSCSHGNHHHKHGVDPHIWTSPRALRTMVNHAHNAIMAHYPDSVKYTEATERLLERIAILDSYCASRIDTADVEAIMIYHPAYTYYARDYGIEQIAIENDGKEPSAKHLTTIIEQAKAKGVTCLLYQAQYPRSTVEIVAKDMGVECRIFDPLAENVIENIRIITRTITNQNVE